MWGCIPYLPFIYFCFNISKNQNIRSIFIEIERMFWYDKYIIKDYKRVLNMYDYSLCEKRNVLCIDQKSFFASVSCIMKGLDPITTKLTVVADTKRQGSVVLAATPPLKAMGIKTGSRLFEIPHRSNIYIINPSMNTYLKVASQIAEISLQYVHRRITINIVSMNSLWMLQRVTNYMQKLLMNWL